MMVLFVHHVLVRVLLFSMCNMCKFIASGKTICSPPRSPRSPKLATSIRRATSYMPTPKLSTIKQQGADVIVTPAADSSPVRNMMRLLDKLPLRTGGSATEGKRSSPLPVDTEDLLTLRYGCKVVLRGSHGRYLAARQDPYEKRENVSSDHPTNGMESSSTKARNCVTTVAAVRVHHFIAHVSDLSYITYIYIYHNTMIYGIVICHYDLYLHCSTYT